MCANSKESGEIRSYNAKMSLLLSLLFVENNEWKAFRHAEVLDCRISLARKLIQNRQPPVFKKLVG